MAQPAAPLSTPSPAPTSDLVDRSEAAAILDLSTSAVRLLQQQGRLTPIPGPVTRGGSRRTLYDRAQVLALRAERTGEPAAPVVASGRSRVEATPRPRTARPHKPHQDLAQVERQLAERERRLDADMADFEREMRAWRAARVARARARTQAMAEQLGELEALARPPAPVARVSDDDVNGARLLSFLERLAEVFAVQTRARGEHG